MFYDEGRNNYFVSLIPGNKEILEKRTDLTFVMRSPSIFSAQSNTRRELPARALHIRHRLQAKSLELHNLHLPDITTPH